MLTQYRVVSRTFGARAPLGALLLSASAPSSKDPFAAAEGVGRCDSMGTASVPSASCSAATAMPRPPPSRRRIRRGAGSESTEGPEEAGRLTCEAGGGRWGVGQSEFRGGCCMLRTCDRGWVEGLVPTRHSPCTLEVAITCDAICVSSSLCFVEFSTRGPSLPASLDGTAGLAGSIACCCMGCCRGGGGGGGFFTANKGVVTCCRATGVATGLAGIPMVVGAPNSALFEATGCCCCCCSEGR
jgi:hypothetical protein